MNDGNVWRVIALVIIAGTIAALVARSVRADSVYINSVDGLKVRMEPDKNSEVVEVLPYGTVVEAEGAGAWLKVDNGYIRSKYTQKTNPLDDMEYMGEWRITAYAETGYKCANGNYPSVEYTIAHNSLPFGTIVYIDGVGFRTVEDRGPAYLGSQWCDLYLQDVFRCIEWGDQYRKVWIYKEG